MNLRTWAKVAGIVAVALLTACGSTESTPSARATQPTAQPSASSARHTVSPVACRSGSSRFDAGALKGVMYVPAVRSGRVPVVVVLHGADADGRTIRAVSQFNDEARAEGFAVMYPNAPGGQWRMRSNAQIRAINSLPRALRCADPKRAYLTGFSMGSAMTFQVACSAQRRAFAAFGGVAYANYSKLCSGAPPAPWVYLHGTADQTVPFQGGDRMYPGHLMPPAPLSMKRWARHNGCRTQSAARTIGSNAVFTRWSSCRARADVHFYALIGNDHQWPFKERPNAALLKPGQSWAGVGATDVMWRFFRTRSLH